MALCLGLDFSLLCIDAHILATHFGNIVAANEWVFERQPLLWNRVYDEPNQGVEGITQACQVAWIGSYAVLVGEQQKCLPFFTKVGFNWSTAASFSDEKTAMSPLFRRRGDT